MCTNNIVHHTGVHCEHLPKLALAQLLELVGWIDFFHKTISNAFPDVASMRKGKTHFEECTELFVDENMTVNKQLERLVWDNLLELQMQSLDDFFVRTRPQTDEWLDKVYDSINKI